MTNKHGYAMPTMLLALALGTFATVSIDRRIRDEATVREQRTAAALALAREALIGRASGDDTRPGSLPCPDIDNDGTADGAFGNCMNYLGRLPWRTLGLAELRDGWGEHLWYALSNTFRDNPAAGVLNSDTPGAISVRNSAGALIVGDAPAVVIAPGRPLETQTRGTAQQTMAAMYLDGENANGDSIYVTGTNRDPFNDRLIIVQRDDLFRPVVARVAREAQAALERYRAAHGYYPAASPYAAEGPAYYCDPATFHGRIPGTISGVGTGCTKHAPWGTEFPAWFFDNQWHLLTLFAVASDCADTLPGTNASCSENAGSLPLVVGNVSDHVRTVTIVSGPARGG